MEKISYQKFLKLISLFSEFNDKTLLALYEKYGKELVNSYFEKASSTLSEDEFFAFAKKYSCYFEREINNNINDVTDASALKTIDYMFYSLGTDNTTLMSQNEEKYYGSILKEAKENLTICSCDNKNLYPILNELDIIKSVIYSENGITLLKEIKSLPYKLHDDNIFKGSLDKIKLFLKNENVISTFKGIENAKINENIDYELMLLKKYVIAKNNFFKRNIRLVFSIAKKYYNSSFSLSDLTQEGTLGLIEAINKYDYLLGNRFSTYATYWIRQKIYQMLKTNGNMIRKPDLVIKQNKLYNDFVSTYFNKYGKYPNVQEISIGTGLSISDINEIVLDLANCASLENPVKNDSEDGSLLKNLLPDTKEDTEKDVLDKELANLINLSFSKYLSEKEKTVLIKRFGLDGSEPKNLEEIGKEYGITRERIRQIEKKALIKMKRNDKKIGLKDYLD